MSRRSQFDLTEFLAKRFSEALGIGLCLFSLVLAVALWGFDANDPSLNHATSGPSSNPLGAFGATLADLCLQTVGTAIWFAVLVLPIWGVRLILDRVPSWIWLSVAALPPAVLALATHFATFEVPPIEVWPYLVGLGGVVGDFALHRLEPGFGARYGLYTLLAALVPAVIAIGITPREAIEGIRNMLGLTTRFERANNAPLRAPAASARTRQPLRPVHEPSLLGRLFGGLGAAIAGVFGLLLRKRDGGAVDQSGITKTLRRASGTSAEREDDPDAPARPARKPRQPAARETPPSGEATELVEPAEK
ncbi:MAG: DNA translocase FtsK 4TM domain-containing protein, partial [Alphaproteobacteria bacterium]|nr:DNA translocase FtsK 4TM domain-containing protein [Alphaproteobacteria bacterium]